MLNYQRVIVHPKKSSVLIHQTHLRKIISAVQHDQQRQERCYGRTETANTQVVFLQHFCTCHSAVAIVNPLNNPMQQTLGTHFGINQLGTWVKNARLWEP